MRNKISFVLVSLILTIINIQCTGNCRRTLFGKVITTESYNNVKIAIQKHYSYFDRPACDTVSIDVTGKYTLTYEANPHNNCENNDCGKSTSTLPDQIQILVLFIRTPVDSIVKDTTFSCAQGYPFSGDDIHFPDIVIP